MWCYAKWNDRELQVAYAYFPGIDQRTVYAPMGVSNKRDAKKELSKFAPKFEAQGFTFMKVIGENYRQVPVRV